MRFVFYFCFNKFVIDTLLYANILIVSASLISKNFDIMLNFFSIIIIIIIFNLISDIPKYFYMSFKTWITYYTEQHCIKSVCIWSYSGLHFSHIFPNLDSIWRGPSAGKCGENADQNNSKYGKFLCSASNIIAAALRVNP